MICGTSAACGASRDGHRASGLRSLQTNCGLLPASPPCLQEPFWLLWLSVEAVSFVTTLDVNVLCCFSVATQKKKN